MLPSTSSHRLMTANFQLLLPVVGVEVYFFPLHVCSLRMLLHLPRSTFPPVHPAIFAFHHQRSPCFSVSHHSPLQHHCYTNTIYHHQQKCRPKNKSPPAPLFLHLPATPTSSSSAPTALATLFTLPSPCSPTLPPTSLPTSPSSAAHATSTSPHIPPRPSAGCSTSSSGIPSPSIQTMSIFLWRPRKLTLEGVSN